MSCFLEATSLLARCVWQTSKVHAVSVPPIIGRIRRAKFSNLAVIAAAAPIKTGVLL